MKGAAVPRAPHPEVGCPAGASLVPAPGPARGGRWKAEGVREEGGSRAWACRLSSAPRRPLPASACSEGRSWVVSGAVRKVLRGVRAGGVLGGKVRTALLHQRDVEACPRRGPFGPVVPLTLPVIVHYAARVVLIKGLLSFHIINPQAVMAARCFRHRCFMP